MADLFVSVVSITPKISQAATQSGDTATSGSKDISGSPAETETNKVTTPGGQTK